MKTKKFLLSLCLILCMLLAGCGGKTENTTNVSDDASAAEQTDTAEPSGNDATEAPDDALADPVLEWCDLYNPNGFDTVTGVITNPNSVPIDVSYDLVYYKNGTEVARSEDFADFDILPGHKSVIWANYDIPKASEADDIKMENIIVTKAYHTPIDGTWEYVGTTDGEAFFDFTFDRQPTLADITFLLYNDTDGNGECGKGEIVVTSTASLMEQTGRVSFETTGYDYTDYEVIFSAY